MFRDFDIINLINNIRISGGIKLRRFRLSRYASKLENKNFTILADNCMAGVSYHDFKFQFLSPLINGAFTTEDFIKFLQSPQFYLNQDLIFVSKDELLPAFYREKGCPLARLGDLYYRFTHYQMPEEKIRTIWNKRKARINWDSVYVVLCEKKGCTLEHMKAFEALPYKKVDFDLSLLS